MAWPHPPHLVHIRHPTLGNGHLFSHHLLIHQGDATGKDRCTKVTVWLWFQIMIFMTTQEDLEDDVDWEDESEEEEEDMAIERQAVSPPTVTIAIPNSSPPISSDPSHFLLPSTDRRSVCGARSSAGGPSQELCHRQTAEEHPSSLLLGRRVSQPLITVLVCREYQYSGTPLMTFFLTYHNYISRSKNDLSPYFAPDFFLFLALNLRHFHFLLPSEQNLLVIPPPLMCGIFKCHK